MNTNKININGNFCRLLLDSGLKNSHTGKYLSEKIKNDMKNIRSIVKANNLHNQENVDILITKKGKKYFAVILSKDEVDAYPTKFKHEITKTSKGIKSLANWVRSWNLAYAKN